MSDAQPRADQVFQYQISWLLIALGLAFSTAIFIFFGNMAMTGSHTLQFLRAIDLGPALSRITWVVFSGFGLLFGLFFALNAVWTATGGRQIVVSSDGVSVPPLLSRAPRFWSFRDIGTLRLKSQGSRLFCVGIGMNGKKIFELDSWQFRSVNDFTDFVAQLQSQGGVSVVQ